MGGSGASTGLIPSETTTMAIRDRISLIPRMSKFLAKVCLICKVGFIVPIRRGSLIEREGAKPFPCDWKQSDL
jgi:hypothetical protein